VQTNVCRLLLSPTFWTAAALVAVMVALFVLMIVGDSGFFVGLG
jgi:hypothetical protein